MLYLKRSEKTKTPKWLVEKASKRDLPLFSVVEKTKMKWRVVLEHDPETADWAVWCPELPGCVSAGETQEEALDNIREAIELYLDPEPLGLSERAIVELKPVDCQ